MLRTHALPARFYATPEYREGYATGALAAQSAEPPENPYLPHDLRHLGWKDASFDHGSALRDGARRGPACRPAARGEATARAFRS